MIDTLDDIGRNLKPEEINWRYICKNRILTERFMREYKDYLYWHVVCENQAMSEEFLIEHIPYINPLSYKSLMRNPRASQIAEKVLVAFKLRGCI